MPHIFPPWSDGFPARRKPAATLRHWARKAGQAVRQDDPRLKALANAYAGRRCFILGNGPSLMKRDLTPLKDEITFGANALFRHFDELGFKTTFWCQVDITQAEDWADEVNHITGMTKFVSMKNAYVYDLAPDLVALNSRYTTRHDDPDNPGAPQFSKDVHSHVFHAQTVTYIAMQLAFYMGFTEVYLIGVDHDYGDLPRLFPVGKPIVTAENIELANQFHFTGQHYKIGDRIGVPKFHIIEAGYQLAREVYEADGRKLVNATDGGKLEIFERESLDAVLARPAPVQTRQGGESVMLKNGTQKLRKAVAKALKIAPADTNAVVAARPKQRSASPATVFEASDGRVHAIDEKLRYNLKPAWEIISGLSLLHELDGRGLLDAEGRELLVRLRGTRTITAPVPEINALVAPYVERHSDIIVGGDISNIGKRTLRPSVEEVDRKVGKARVNHERKLAELRGLGINLTPAGSSLLEIGFISGGESIVAFDRLGFDAYGLDYFYDGAFDTVARYEEVRTLSRTNANFMFGDLTKRTQFEDGQFDLIYSSEVLEHITDLKSAFREMYRLLKPGGVMLHVWDPYFHPMGGHAFGTLDFPWGHLRLTEADRDRYLQELRPHEAEYAVPWCRTSINRQNTQAVIQHDLVDQGFAIRSWRTRPLIAQPGVVLDTDVIRECLDKNPQVSLSDLTTRTVQVIAEKPA